MHPAESAPESKAVFFLTFADGSFLSDRHVRSEPTRGQRMAKNIKYYFDHASLSYKKVRIGFLTRLRNVLLWFITTGSVWIVIYFIITRFIPTPKELTLQRELDNMTLNYEMLQKQMDENEQRLSEIENRDDNLYRVIFETDPYPSDRRSGTISGQEYFEKMRGERYSDMIASATERIEKLTKRLYAESKSLDEVADLALRKKDMISSIPAVPPVTIDIVRRTLVSGYGLRLHPISKVWRMHTGMDFAAKIGTPIYATGDGVVTFAGSDASGYGIHVIIDHGYGYQTLYGHMSKLHTQKGRRVKRGEIIGEIGNTGQSTGPHLHYEVIYRGQKVNPINYYYKDITPEEYNALLEMASQHTSPFD